MLSYFDASLFNGLIDLSDYLSVTNSFSSKTPDMTGRNSDLDVSSLHYKAVHYITKAIEEFDGYLDLLREETASLFERVIHTPRNLRSASAGDIDRALNVIETRLKSWKIDGNPDYQECADILDACRESFQDLFDKVEDAWYSVVDIFEGSKNEPMRENLWPIFYQKLRDARTVEEYTNLIYDTCFSTVERPNEDYSRNAIKKIRFKGQIITQDFIEKLIDKAVSYSRKMGRLLNGLRDNGFQWTPESLWFNNSYPAELVACVNLLFGNTLAKAVINCEPMGYDIKYKNEEELKEIFAHQIEKKYGQNNYTARRYGYMDDENGKRIAYWEFIHTGSKKELNKIITVHIIHDIPSSSIRKIHIDQEKNNPGPRLNPQGEQQQEKYGNDEVGRLVFLLDMFRFNKYKPLELDTDYNEQRKIGSSMS